MSDRYRPSGPKSSRFNEEYDRSRGPGRGSDRDRDRDHDHDRAFDERDFNDRKSQSESSRDYYAPPVRVRTVAAVVAVVTVVAASAMTIVTIIEKGTQEVLRQGVGVKPVIAID